MLKILCVILLVRTILSFWKERTYDVYKEQIYVAIDQVEELEFKLHPLNMDVNKLLYSTLYCFRGIKIVWILILMQAVPGIFWLAIIVLFLNVYNFINEVFLTTNLAGARSYLELLISKRYYNMDLIMGAATIIFYGTILFL